MGVKCSLARSISRSIAPRSQRRRRSTLRCCNAAPLDPSRPAPPPPSDGAAGTPSPSLLLLTRFFWYAVPGTFLPPYRAVPVPRSGTKVPGTGNTATYRVPCDCAVYGLVRRGTVSTLFLFNRPFTLLLVVFSL